jgi:hypothetical protein
MDLEEEREVKTKLYNLSALINPVSGRRWWMGISFLSSWPNVIRGQDWSGVKGFARNCSLLKEASLR